MNSIESITSKITADANASAQEKIREAEEAATSILNDFKTQAENVKKEASEAAQKEAELLLERVDSQAQLAHRNLVLQYRRTAISKAFENSLDVMCSRSQSEQIAFLSDVAVKYQTKDASVILNEKDKAAFGNTLVEEIQKKLDKASKNIKISLSDKTGNFAGGMILVEGSIETNCSYEVLIKNIREEIENDVADVLFGK